MTADALAPAFQSPAETGIVSGAEVLARFADPSLADLFAPQPRAGVQSAWHGHVPFARWLVPAIAPRTIVELGTHNGVSYAAFCEGVLGHGLATRCYAVDTWKGDAHAGEYGDAVYDALRRFHDGRYGGFSELIRATFEEARDYVADGSVDLLHIDGFHTYEAVRGDFESWQEKLSPRGVVLFHDTNVLERGFGVCRFWREVAARYPAFEFLHGHGLGVLAVGPEVPEAIRALCALGEEAAGWLRTRFATLGRLHESDHEVALLQERAVREAGFAADRDAAVAQLQGYLGEGEKAREGLITAEAEARRRAEAAEAGRAELAEALARQKAAADAATTYSELARTEIQELRAALARAKGAEAELRQAENGQRAEAAMLRDAVGELQAAVGARDARIAAILASTSWRVTAPMRRLKGG